MATLDSRFYCTSDLDTYYVDNATGEPLAGGIVIFYSDVNRTSLKPVYQLTGTPGNYSFSVLPNPCTLSSAGTFQDDNGNNIVPYYYPFMGTQEENTGIEELYYIMVKNSGGSRQFTRQAWPPIIANDISPTTESEITNFIPNGQFLSHTNITSLTNPPITSFIFGAQTINAQPIAQGGWYFAYTNGTTATFNNSFSQIPSSGGWGANNFPKYLFNFNCTGIGDTPLTRDLWITWPDINKFSSGNPPGSTSYTLYFDARSNDSNAYTFTLYQIYYFGTGGAASTSFFSSPIATITIGPSGTLSSVNIQDINFLVNQGNIGTSENDFIGLALRGPMGGWNVSLSDFLLVSGNKIFNSFPIETNDEMLSRGVAGFMPTPATAGSDLYLPLILTPKGMTFDHSIVGQIIGKTQTAANAVNNELLMDGSAFTFSGYSSLGIPYSRLGSYLLQNSAGLTAPGGSSIGAGVIPIYGTGTSFVSIWLNSVAGKFDLNFNTASGSNTVSNGTSGFTHTSADPLYVFTIPGIPSAGTYFTFTPAASGLVFNVWFTVDGAGTAPATPTGANILVSLVTGDTIATTRSKIQVAVNQYQFALLDARGYFWRGLDPSGTIDPDVATRTDNIKYNGSAIVTATLGTFEAASFLQHTHTVAINGIIQNYCGDGESSTYNTTGPTTTTFTSANASQGGGSETRPINLALNWFIKY